MSEPTEPVMSKQLTFSATISALTMVLFVLTILAGEVGSTIGLQFGEPEMFSSTALID